MNPNCQKNVVYILKWINGYFFDISYERMGAIKKYSITRFNAYIIRVYVSFEIQASLFLDIIYIMSTHFKEILMTLIKQF